MLPFLHEYPSPDASIIEAGFQNSFSLHRTVNNHRSAHGRAYIVKDIVRKHISLGRIVGIFKEKPVSNLRFSAVVLVPKKSNNPDPNSTDNWHFIHDLSTFPQMLIYGCLKNRAK